MSKPVDVLRASEPLFWHLSRRIVEILGYAYSLEFGQSGFTNCEYPALDERETIHEQCLFFWGGGGGSGRREVSAADGLMSMDPECLGQFLGAAGFGMSHILLVSAN